MDKKEKIKALEMQFGVKAKYLGVPSCAYETRTGKETYTIDRVGKVKNSQDSEIDLDTIIHATHSVNQRLKPQFQKNPRKY
jgi:hypothetical protein